MAEIAYDDETEFIPEWTFADRLRKARSTAGMDQRTFASHLQCTAGAYAQWEADNSRPRDIVGLARRVEMLTRIPASWLLDLNPSTRKAPTPTSGRGGASGISGFVLIEGGMSGVGPTGIEPMTSTV